MVITSDRSEPATEPELLSRARDGDAPAFCLLIEPRQARLLRQAVALSGNLSASEDLVSETLGRGVEEFVALRRDVPVVHLALFHSAASLPESRPPRPLAPAFAS